MFFYRAHGLSIQSYLALPELLEGGSGLDVRIQFGKILWPKSDNCFEKTSGLNKFRITDEATYFNWNNINICKISNGNEIIVNPYTGLDDDFLRLLLLSTSFGILLHQRGRLVLHANAVNMKGNAVVFSGPIGSGKSTTSLVLHKNGYNLLSDDVLSIKVDKEALPLVYPSFPRMKLWPEVIEVVDENPELLPKIHFNTEKRSYGTLDNFLQTSKPVKTIYLIEEGNETSIDELDLNKSLIEIIKSTYLLKIFNKDELADNLTQCVRLVNNVPVKRLNIKRSFENLPKLVKIIEDDVFD